MPNSLAGFQKKNIFNAYFFKLTLQEPKFPEDNQIFYPPHIVIFYHIIFIRYSTTVLYLPSRKCEVKYKPRSSLSRWKKEGVDRI